jgi:quercetin dioxygenase-like cupin family protein
MGPAMVPPPQEIRSSDEGLPAAGDRHRAVTVNDSNRIKALGGRQRGGFMPRKKTDKLEPVGRRIKKARTAKKVTFDRLANETGFSVDYLKEIESGKEIPPVGALLQISRALELDAGYLLREEEANLKKRIKAFTKRTENYAYTTLTPGAENKHLKAFKVTVDALQDHKGVGYQHEGEEFVYVLKGDMEIIVGDHVNRLKTGDSLHFNSGIRHKMRNVGKENAELIVVVYGH